MKNKKAFTLIELIAVLVILAILALIVTPIVLNIVKRSKESANKRSVDAYGKSIELAVANYLLDKGEFPTNISDLEIEYSGEEVICNISLLNEDSSVYLSECKVGSSDVKDKNTSDGWYHYGKKSLTNEEYVDMYGKSLEKAISEYKASNNKLPEDYQTLKLDYNLKSIKCNVTINYDGTVYLTECILDKKEVKDSNNEDGYYHYGKIKYKTYKIGDEITYNGINFYVIENSDENSDSVTLLKEEPLTVAEVNKYGGVGTENNHVNKNTFESKGTAYDNNGYGGMAYYSSSTCRYNSSKIIKDGCMTDYAKSEVKYVVDAWALDKLKANDLKEDKTGYSARLITFDDLVDNLGYEKKNSGTLNASSNGETPSWVYNSKYWYYTMSQYGDYTDLVWNVGYDGSVYNSSVDNLGGSVRPVITIKKSAI